MLRRSRRITPTGPSSGRPATSFSSKYRPGSPSSLLQVNIRSTKSIRTGLANFSQLSLDGSQAISATRGRSRIKKSAKKRPVRRQRRAFRYMLYPTQLSWVAFLSASYYVGSSIYVCTIQHTTIMLCTARYFHQPVVSEWVQSADNFY